jgi:hypothetical protein
MGVKKALIITALFLPIRCLDAQEIRQSVIDSITTIRQYELRFDAGFYPFRYDFSGGFQPTLNAQIGLIRELENVQLAGFLEFTNHEYVSSSGLLSHTESTKRYDIAIYAAVIVFRVLFVGGGIYYSHRDKVVTSDFIGNLTVADSPIQSHFALYYLIGLQYPVSVSDRISIPIGLYYRNQENQRDTFPAYQVSLRIGVSYEL